MDMNSLKELAQPVLAGWVRHAIVGMGFMGVASDSNVNTIVGAAMILAGLAWSAWQKYVTKSPEAPHA